MGSAYTIAPPDESSSSTGYEIVPPDANGYSIAPPDDIQQKAKSAAILDESTKLDRGQSPAAPAKPLGFSIEPPAPSAAEQEFRSQLEQRGGAPLARQTSVQTPSAGTVPVAPKFQPVPDKTTLARPAQADAVGYGGEQKTGLAGLPFPEHTNLFDAQSRAAADQTVDEARAAMGGKENIFEYAAEHPELTAGNAVFPGAGNLLEGGTKLLTKGQRAAGAVEAAGGAADVLMPSVTKAFFEAPVGLAAGLAAGKAAEKIGPTRRIAAKLGADEDTKEAARQVDFWLPTIAGSLLGLKYGGGAKPVYDADGNFLGTVEAAGGGSTKAGVGFGVVSTPTEHRFGVKVGDRVYEVRVPRGGAQTKTEQIGEGSEAEAVANEPKPTAPTAKNPEESTEVTSGRPVVQASDNPAELRKSAEQQQPKLEDMAEQAVAQVPGAKVEGSRVKDAESQQNKDDRGKPAATNIDNLGARVSAETPEQVAELEKQVEQTLPVVSKDKIDNNGLDATQYGIQTGKPGEANQVSELQVMDARQADAVKQTDALYDQQKQALAAGDQAKADALGQQIEAIHQQAQRSGVTPDRRTDLAKRKLVAQMSPEEMQRELLTSEAVDLPNKRAFEEAERQQPAKAYGRSDADGLKALNDTYGYEAGNALLQAKAEALKEAGLEAYHEKGDEFMYRGDNEEVLRTRLEKAREILRNREFEVTTPDGKILILKGADFSYGTGSDLKAAEAGQHEHKADREARGERKRGELRGISERQVSEGQQGKAPAEEVKSPALKAEQSLKRGTSVQLPDGSFGKLEGYNPNMDRGFVNGKSYKAAQLKPVTPPAKPIELPAESIEELKKPGNFIGVDLDRTLATYGDWKGITHIGEPIENTVRQVQHWLAEGKDVRVFTARTSHDPGGEGKRAIEAWTKQHIGQQLKVENKKLPQMVAMVDDRGVNVAANEGTPVGVAQTRTPETSESGETTETPRYKFGNTQADIPADSEAAQAIEKLRESIPAADLMGDGKDIGGNHITVRYGIKGDDTAGIRAFIEKQAPFTAKLGATSKFPPSKHSDGAAPIIAPIEAPELHRLNAEMEKHGDFAPSSFPEYKPHATVAYVKPEAADKYVGLKDTAGKTFRVTSISITDRNGNADSVELKGQANEQRNSEQQPTAAKAESERTNASQPSNEPVSKEETAQRQPERSDRNQPAPGKGNPDELRTEGRGGHSGARGAEQAGEENPPEPAPPARQEQGGEKAKPLGVTDNANGESEDPLVRASLFGIDILAEKLSKAAIAESLRSEAALIKSSRELQADIYDLEKQQEADQLRILQLIARAPLKPSDDAQIYHYLENPLGEKLTAEQQKQYEETVKPFMDETERIVTKLKGAGALVPNYVHREVKSSGSWLDRALSGASKSKGVGKGNVLSKGAPAAKGRTVMALQSEDGQRLVASVKNGRVTAWQDREPADLGALKGGLNTAEGLLHEQIAPINREIRKLEEERRILKATRSRIESTFQRRANIATRIDELERQREQLVNSVGLNELKNEYFTDKNGREWRFDQATTREIEKHTSLEYHHSALGSAASSFLSLRRAERAYDFLEGLKQSPGFASIARKISEGNLPDGWRQSSIPQLNGYAFQPHHREVLDWFAEQLNHDGPGAIEKVGQFLRTAIFYSPLMHVPNLVVHWAVEKGKLGLGVPLALFSKASRDAAVKAVNAVVHQNDDYLAALDAGAPLQSHRDDLRELNRQIFDKLGQELSEDEKVAEKVANALGYANPKNLIKAWYKLSGLITWSANDIAFLQAAYEKTAKGISLKDALRETAKHLPDYRVPTRIADSPELGKVLNNRLLVMFGGYHYGMVKSYGQALRSAIGLGERPPAADEEAEPGGPDWRDIAHGWDVLAAIGVFLFIYYPLLDQLVRKISGNKDATLRRAGATTLPHNLMQLAKGERSVSDVLQSVVTPAVLPKRALELGFNRDLRTGRQLYDPHADWHTIMRQVGHEVGTSIAPIDQAARASASSDSTERALWNAVGVSFPKHGAEKIAQDIAMSKMGTEASDPESRERAIARRDAIDALRRNDRQPLRDALKSGKLTAEEAREAAALSRKSRLYAQVYHFNYAELMRVYDVATPEQKRELEGLRIKKFREYLANQAKHGIRVQQADDQGAGSSE